VFLHADAARDLLALMDNLGIGRARAIGASSGGMTLLYAATMAPERFERLVLVGAQIYYSKAVREWALTHGHWEKDPEIMKRLAQAHGQSRGLQVARQFWRFRTLYDDPAFTPDKLATISARTLIIHGDNDFVPIAQALEMYHSIPSARLWIVPNGGHLPYLAQENHVDFVRRVTEFLEGKWDTPSK
jgi:pimeloyl-ACP methyl ester carboxylesterase